MSNYNNQKSRQMQSMLVPAQERLKKYTAEELSRKGHVTYDPEAQGFRFLSMGQEIFIPYPSFEIEQDLEMWHHLTVLQYMDTADGSLLEDRWISLPEMTGGLSRGAGFDKDISTMFARYFENVSAKEFREACLHLGGEILEGKADVSAKIPYAPMFPVFVNFWEGDDEFPASGKTLVDANAEHYLTIEAAGGACSAVVRRICEVVGKEEVL